VKIHPTDLFSKTCYPIEEIRKFQKSVIEEIDKAIKTQIAKFEAKNKG
jgi:hypothetical protein